MKEYHFADLSEEEVYTALSPYRFRVESEFQRVCKNNLDYNKDGDGYAADLSAEEADIIASGIVSYWMKTYVNDSDYWKNAIGTKNHSVFSNANLLTAMSAVQSNLELDYRTKMNTYSFLHGNVIRSGLSKRRELS